MKQKHVLSLGALAMDTVLSVPFLPQDDGFSFIASERMVPGGSASNVSAALSKLGAAVCQAGKIGDDEPGRLFRQDLIDYGVDVHALAEQPGGVTMHTYIFTAPAGKHCIFVNRGDCQRRYAFEELPSDILENCICFYNDLSYPEVSLRLAEQAVERGIPVVFNIECLPSLMQGYCGAGDETLARMLALSSLVIGGSDAIAELCGGEPEEKGGVLMGRYRPSDGVIVTCGSRGAIWFSGGGREHVPAFRVEPVDTTGAGDCMAAGLIYARYCAGCESRAAALRFASAAAALKCTVAGPRSTADLAAVRAFLKEQGAPCDEV